MLRFFTTLITVIFCVAFAVFADGIDDLMPVTTEQEVNIGASVARTVEKRFEDADDPLTQERFEKIGKNLALACDRHDLIWKFTVLKAKKGEEDKYLNAFALPGGYVYIFDEMMNMLKTDDEIAAVIAHEMGHICARHAVKRLHQSMGLNVLMVLAATTAKDGNTVADTGEALTQLMMAYSREDEFEADKLSVKYTRESGYDPQGALKSLRKLQSMRRKGPEMKYTYYKSHPYLSERIAYVREEIKGYPDFDSYINIPNRNAEFR